MCCTICCIIILQEVEQCAHCAAEILKHKSLALAIMARDDPPANRTASRRAANSTAIGARAVKWDRNLKPKLAIMRQCTFVTDRRTDEQTDWHHGISAICILHLALKMDQHLTNLM